MARGAERRALIAATILIWAMGSMLYAHMHHWDLLDRSLTNISSSTAAVDSSELEALSSQITSLEHREAALTSALQSWRSSGAVPDKLNLRELGLPAHAVEAYEVATADAAAESAAAAARATAANAGEIKAHASLPMTPLAVSSANVGRAAPVAAPVVAAPSAPSVAASAHHDANRNSYAQAEMTSEAASGIIFDTSIAKKIEHMHVLRSGSLDFSHSQPPPPPQPLPPALPPAEASGTPGVDHRVNTPVEAAAVVVSAAAPSAAVLPAGATTATLAAASADAPAAAEGAVGGPEDLGARIAALGGRARRLVDKKPNAVVVVGGSDGSGTRSVVALLEKLGVFMVVDDRGTNDVHAAEMGGWPPVVSPVLEAAKGGDYEVGKLPRNVREGTHGRLARFISSMARQGTSGKQRVAKRADAGHHFGPARGVAYGYKAPVSMLLVPFFMETYAKEGLKYLQVVRDGRDISFSGNQSPVTKFYRNTFNSAAYNKWDHMPEVRAMQLWSSWNADVAELGARHNAAQNPSYEHLVVHTEDLIDPETKFEAVRQIAGFVGAESLTNDDLCCMVVQPEEFMGSHAKDVQGRGEKGSKATDKLASRFGHWHAKLDNKPALSEALHREGARGLALFGYEPEQEHLLPPLDGYTCALTPAKCLAMGNPYAKAPGSSKQGLASLKSNEHRQASGSSAVPSDSDHCVFDKGMDYPGQAAGDLVAVSVNDAAACCTDCLRHEGCAYFTYVPEQSMCYLKRSKGHDVRDSPGMISGHAH